jgi:hypothetical protein
VEIAVFYAAERLSLTCAWITRTVNRLSHVWSARRTTCLPLIEDSFPNDLEFQ